MYFSAAKLRIENPFNSIQLKQKITYTGPCHAVIQLFLNFQFPAKDEELFLLHQSPCVSLFFVAVFEADYEAILLAWATCQQNDDVVVVVTHVTGMRTYSSRLIRT